jgi:hypothetical protein
MKTSKILLCSVLAGMIAFAAGNASARSEIMTSMPLKLMSVSGTAYTTANYDGTKTTTPYNQMSFNTKNVMDLIAGIIKERTGKVVPKDVELIYDPILDSTYLTNKFGYYYDTGNFAYVYFYDIATSYRGTFYNGSENDIVGVEFDVYGYNTDGLYYEFEIYGTGNLTASFTGNMAALLTKSAATRMNLTLKNGTGYAEYQSSDSGMVGDGQLTFSGMGAVPSYAFPFSAYWWNYID